MGPRTMWGTITKFDTVHSAFQQTFILVIVLNIFWNLKYNIRFYRARTQILKQQDAKDREKHVMKFIKIMKHLRKINNFNSYLALLSALDSAPIRRLEWQKNITEGSNTLLDAIYSFWHRCIIFRIERILRSHRFKFKLQSIQTSVERDRSSVYSLHRPCFTRFDFRSYRKSRFPSGWFYQFLKTMAAI